MTIADRIKLKREEQHLSQDELAKKCGYADKTSISKIENSGDDITLKKIKRIANALNVSHSYLMGWEDSADIMYADVVDEPRTDKIVLAESDIGLMPRRAITVSVEKPNIISKEIEEAKRLYELYAQAPPEIQAAVETLLKATRSDS